jgi:hypothetical protein
MMPISTTAPKTGRDISQRVLLALFVAFAVQPAPAAAVATPTPAPIAPLPMQPSTGAMGYYMMQGSRIVSAPYPSAPACFKAVEALMKTLPANTAPIVCAHRRP